MMGLKKYYKKLTEKHVCEYSGTSRLGRNIVIAEPVCQTATCLPIDCQTNLALIHLFPVFCGLWTESKSTFIQAVPYFTSLLRIPKPFYIVYVLWVKKSDVQNTFFMSFYCYSWISFRESWWSCILYTRLKGMTAVSVVLQVVLPYCLVSISGLFELQGCPPLLSQVSPAHCHVQEQG